MGHARCVGTTALAVVFLAAVPPAFGQAADESASKSSEQDTEPSSDESKAGEDDSSDEEERGRESRASEDGETAATSSSSDGDEGEASIEAELDAIEREVEDSDDETDGSTGGESGGGSGSAPASSNALNPELSVILSAGVAETIDEPLLVGGPDPKRFGFFLQALELAVRADVDPYFTFDAHLVAKLSGLKVGEAYGTTLSLPANLQMRFGKFKTRFGRVNPRHAHAWHFTALPVVNGKFLGPAGLNGLGVEVSQILPLPWYAEWVVAVQDLSGPPVGRSFLRKPGRMSGPLDLVASGRIEQFWEIGGDWSLLWGLNGAIGRNDAPDPGAEAPGHSEIYGTDLHLRWKSTKRQQVAWQTEMMLRRRTAANGRLTDAGGYSYVYWIPNPRWEFGARWEFVSGVFEGRDDYLDPDWERTRQRAGLAASFYPTEFSRFRVEYMASDFARGFDGLGHTVLLHTQLVTGAHGAHEF